MQIRNLCSFEVEPYIPYTLRRSKGLRVLGPAFLLRRSYTLLAP